MVRHVPPFRTNEDAANKENKMNEEMKKDESVASEANGNEVTINVSKDSKMAGIPLDANGKAVCEEEDDEGAQGCADESSDVEEECAEEPELKKSTVKPTELKAKSAKHKAKSEYMEETMLRLLLTEQNPELLESALARGKTIHGAWNYVVSVMKNAYIAKHGRVNGGMCGSPAVVLGIAEKYLREYDEGTLEPEVSHTPKKSEKPAPKTSSAKSEKKEDAKKIVEKTVKKAARDSKAKKVSAQEDFFAALGL